jgi:hypothetical protein
MQIMATTGVASLVNVRLIQIMARTKSLRYDLWYPLSAAIGYGPESFEYRSIRNEDDGNAPRRVRAAFVTVTTSP